MRFYFDTNCIRRINNLPKEHHKNIVASQLSIFETISGIKSEHEYNKRKKILEAIKNSDIKIIWDSPKTLLIKAFNFPIHDTDVEATKIMMDKIINSQSYDEIKSVRFNLGSEDYTIDTFIEHDISFNKENFLALDFAATAPDKDQRREFRQAEKVMLQQTDIQLEMVIRNFLLDQLGPNISVQDDDYLDSVKSFYRNHQLVDFIKGIIVGVVGGLARGQSPGDNDGFDYAHLAYAHMVNYFVSDDKFFKKFKGNKILKVNFINFNDYKEISK